jgi:hypothetical protein
LIAPSSVTQRDASSPAGPSTTGSTDRDAHVRPLTIAATTTPANRNTPLHRMHLISHHPWSEQ